MHREIFQEKHSMSVSSQPPAVRSAEEAIERVLEAERLGREAVARCEAQAAEILNAARAAARRIADRTDDRLSATHVMCMESTGRKIIALEEAEQRLAEQPVLDEAGLKRARNAARVLAALLSGGKT